MPFIKGQTAWNKGIKGQVPWNKGKKGVQVAWNKGTKGLMAIPWNKGKEWIEMKGHTHGFQKGQTSWNKGKKGIYSDETKKKMGIANIGNKYTLDKHWKIKDTSKMGESKKGEKNWRWIKDRTQLKKSERKDKDVQYIYWARQVKNRDNWKCRIINSDCKGRLESHHILNWIDYPELRYDINNGITLCHFHHPRKWEEEKRLSPYFMELVSVSKE